MQVNRMFKSIMYLIVSVFGLYFLGGVVPRMIELIDAGSEKTFLIAVYWLGILSILAIPQYVAWFLDEDIELIAPLKSIAAFAISTMAIGVVTIFSTKFFNVITLSDTSSMIWSLCFWLFAILGMYVPQLFVFQPLKDMVEERFHSG